MAAKFKPSSFIPNEQAVQEAGSRVKHHSSGTNFFLMIAVIIFVLAVLTGVAAFLYERNAQSDLNETQAQLEEAQGNLNPSLVAELAELDTKLKAAETIMSNHIVATPVFELLEDATLRSVGFTAFTFTREEAQSSGNNENAGVNTVVTMEGTANSYPAIALQSDMFSENPDLNNVTFSEFANDEEGGGITFSVSFEVEPQLLSYNLSADSEDTDNTQEQETEGDAPTPSEASDDAPDS